MVLIYYLGVICMVAGVVCIFIFRFKEYDKIDIKKHLFTIVIYVILLVLSIILWGILSNFFFGAKEMLQNQNTNFKRVLNG